MGSVKRTFTLPNDVSDELDSSIPNRERSRFIAATLREALKDQKRQKLLKLIETMPRVANPKRLRSEDLIHELRSERANEVLAPNKP